MELTLSKSQIDELKKIHVAVSASLGEQHSRVLVRESATAMLTVGAHREASKVAEAYPLAMLTIEAHREAAKIAEGIK